jgi:archaea-specific DNA-binding protein
MKPGNKPNKRDNSVFIGNKPFMNYVTSVVMQFTSKNSSQVFIKARGKFISRAVDVAEVACKRFLESTVEVGTINIDSEAFTNKEGKNVRVSTVEIALKRK